MSSNSQYDRNPGHRELASVDNGVATMVRCHIQCAISRARIESPEAARYLAASSVHMGLPDMGLGRREIDHLDTGSRDGGCRTIPPMKMVGLDISAL